MLGSEEERIERKVHVRKQQADLLAIAKSRAQKLLFEGNFDLAIPAALQALRFSLLVYSQESIELVPAYLLLGEASIGLSQYKQAEDYLSLAKWAVLKSNTKDNHIKSQLHRNFGQLYAAKGEYELAKDELAQDVH